MSEKIPTTNTELNQAEIGCEIQLGEEIAELEKPIKIIIEKIKNRIENGEYGLIIGDDASGRIPTRILGDFIREISRIRGHHQPNIIFIPGKLKEGMLGVVGSGERQMVQKKFEQHLSKYGAIPDKKILIITDTVFSGESLRGLADLIKEAGYVLEIATIGQEFSGPFGRPNRLADENLEGIEIVSGEFSATKEQEEETGWAHTPMIYAKKDMSGVHKSSGYLKSERLVDEIGSYFRRDMIQDEIEQARKDAKTMTSKLIDWYESQKQNEK
ncbi:MAG: hypothetical protein UT29_C0001G0164 [Candidatus Yanofskybacteria bacterium GW2011_GWA1_39_13]|uniref:Phosphoribosyltransferase domain-containing protein n=1 Tax=Yanofskybacteria sp. (strain GW2011_GWA1_39_13) TaxID=1619019 RepID=A0A0G0MF68_YANXG|nr:MAG: hypothetical protein UT29_C0001G0164 [Candidatus Yanofskybacteria bacterium GW2011_GWA1_39_13]